MSRQSLASRQNRRHQRYQKPVIETVKDEVTGIAVKGELNQGTTVTVNQMAEESEQYAAYTERVKAIPFLRI